MTVSTNWGYLGEKNSNDEVAELLNSGPVGACAAVTLNTKSSFIVWGNKDKGEIIPGNLWKALGERGDNGDVRDLLQSRNAAGGIVTLNSQNRFVVWGYVEPG